MPENPAAEYFAIYSLGAQFVGAAAAIANAAYHATGVRIRDLPPWLNREARPGARAGTESTGVGGHS